MNLTATYGTKILKYWKIIIVHFENINSGINLNNISRSKYIFGKQQNDKYYCQVYIYHLVIF